MSTLKTYTFIRDVSVRTEVYIVKANSENEAFELVEANPSEYVTDSTECDDEKDFDLVDES